MVKMIMLFEFDQDQMDVHDLCTSIDQINLNLLSDWMMWTSLTQMPPTMFHEEIEIPKHSFDHFESYSILSYLKLSNMKCWFHWTLLPHFIFQKHFQFFQASAMIWAKVDYTLSTHGFLKDIRIALTKLFTDFRQSAKIVVQSFCSK